LSRKELIKCLRAKVPFEQAGSKDMEKQENERRTAKKYEERGERRKKYEEQRGYPPAPSQEPAPLQEEVQVPIPPSEQTASPNSGQLSEVPPKLLSSLDELENTLRARFYNPALEVIKEMPVRDMIKSLEEEKEVYAIVFDGIITQRLADLAESKKVACLIGIKLGNVFRKPQSVLIHTKT
ncbi:MAG: hypothetical protein QW275_02950, partial [Candidatus Anstonellaceae archaeon]